MSTPITSPDVRVQVPELHSNPVLSGFQILGWIILHPSAWYKQVSHIDSTLPADFTLAELRPAHWRHRVMRQLLTVGYLFLPLATSLLVGLLLLVTGQPSHNVVYAMIYCFTCALVVGLIGGLGVGVA